MHHALQVIAGALIIAVIVAIVVAVRTAGRIKGAITAAASATSGKGAPAAGPAGGREVKSRSQEIVIESGRVRKTGKGIKKKERRGERGAKGVKVMVMMMMMTMRAFLIEKEIGMRMEGSAAAAGGPPHRLATRDPTPAKPAAKPQASGNTGTRTGARVHIMRRIEEVAGVAITAAGEEERGAGRLLLILTFIMRCTTRIPIIAAIIIIIIRRNIGSNRSHVHMFGPVAHQITRVNTSPPNPELMGGETGG